MELEWQLFAGGRIMFWVTTVLLIMFILTYILTFVIDPVSSIYMKTQNIDETSIKEMSEQYVNSLGITIKKPVYYRFVKFRYEHDLSDSADSDMVLLGTFHEWNNNYYIDISADLYHMSMLYEIVRHETRHMIVQELKNEKIIDLDDYTEEIAQEKDEAYNELFNCSVKLLKEKTQ